MNKFSSLSTSVLLALLTSSFMVAAYADGEGPSRTSPRESNNSINGTAATGTVMGTEETKKYKLNAINANPALRAAPNAATAAEQEAAPLLYDQQGLPIISINDPQVPLRTPPKYPAMTTLAPKVATAKITSLTPAPTLAMLDSSHPSTIQSEVIEDDVVNVPFATAPFLTKTMAPTTTQANNTKLASMSLIQAKANLLKEEGEEVTKIITTPEQFSSIVDMTLTEHIIDLKKEDHENIEETEKTTLDTDEPHLLKIAFEHPSTFSNSFIVAGDSTVIAYNNDQGNFSISFKLRPLSLLELQTINFELFKKQLTARFSDRQNMLYGEYDILHAYASVKDAHTAHALPELKIGKNSTMVLNPSDPYMDLSFKAFLKKNRDGILPDQHSFFYERNILTKGYLATLNCALYGSPAQTNLTQQYFEAFSPLCERILDSYSFAFVK